MPFNWGYVKIKAKVIAKHIRRAKLISKEPNIPIIYLPGILGSKLYDIENKRLIWGDYNSLIHKNNYEYVESASNIEASQLHRFSIIPGIVDSLITAPLKQVLETALNYRDGIDLFFLGHDWRADNRLLAQELSNKINQIKQTHGQKQKIILIAHSSSNSAIRYYLQSASQHERDSITKWYAFGPPWQGTFQSLHLINSGYYPAGKFFYGFTADEIASCPSAFQLLPAFAKIIDKQGKPILDFDVYDENCWKEFHIGPYQTTTTQNPALRTRVQEKLADNLAQAKNFSQYVARRTPNEIAIAQTWFLSNNHITVKQAIYDNEQLYTDALLIQKEFPHLANIALTKGDDHLPIEGLLEGWHDAIIQTPEQPPFGQNYAYINQARTHRGLVSHIPNLQILAFDIATLNQRVTYE